MGQDTITFELEKLVKCITKNKSDYCCMKTYQLLCTIFNTTLSSEKIENVSILYRLIFYSFKQNPITAYTILSGFIKFGQSNDGKQYKPLLDHLTTEAYDKLLELGGWSILRDSLNTFRIQLDNLNEELIFQHIMTLILNQLYADEHEVESLDNLSDMCHYLPREKSFSWGWFSYYIASAYYSQETHTNDKQLMRRSLMQYRKLLTRLRKIVPCHKAMAEEKEVQDQVHDQVRVKTPAETFILLEDQEYKWAADLIEHSMGTSSPSTMEDLYAHEELHAFEEHEEQHTTIAALKEALLYATELEKFHTEVMQQAQEAREKQQQEQEEQAQEEQAQAQEQAQAPAPAVEKKEQTNNTGWLSWFGWS